MDVLKLGWERVNAQARKKKIALVFIKLVFIKLGGSSAVGQYVNGGVTL